MGEGNKLEKRSKLGFKEVLDGTMDFSRIFFGSVLKSNSSPYFLPTVFGKAKKEFRENRSLFGFSLKNSLEKSSSYKEIENKSLEAQQRYISFLSSATVGSAGIVAQASIYADNPEYLAVPLATNVASGLYEGGKALYNKFKDKPSEE